MDLTYQESINQDPLKDPTNQNLIDQDHDNPENCATLKNKIDTDMKKYEGKYEMQIPGDHAFIVRADGHCFSKFTKGFHQPFDENLKNAMIRATGDAIVHFSCSTGYTHSDEITLIFAPMPLLNGEIQPHSFNGRVCKLLTLVSSFISIRFNYHLLELVLATKLGSSQPYTEKFIERIKNINASFDARVLVFSPDKFNDIARHMIWRSLKDCSRNAVSAYARYFFSSKELHNKKSKELIEMMKTIKNFDYHTQVPEHEKIGTYLKKELFEINAVNKQTGISEKTIRSRIVSKTLRADTSENFIQLLLAKYF
jgi:tRNA(His) 5'-end guanylyltransferase